MVQLSTAAATALIAKRTAENPYATYSVDALKASQHKGACYSAPPPVELAAAAARSPLTFSEEELRHAASASVSVDWRAHGAVGPIQQQHPYGTCWAFSMTAVTEAISVIQGKNAYEKLSEQMTISCVPPTACGDNSDVLWEWALGATGGKYQTEEVYPYNRTCNFFREQQLAPDGTNDGYPGTCNLPGNPPYAPCPPCPGVQRKDGTPPCNLDESKGFSNADVQGWGSVSPHGVDVDAESAHANAGAPFDVTRMVAAVLKYGPAQIGIDASCIEGYTGGIITNCTSHNVDHAVAIVGAETDAATGIAYWIVRNSWNTTFGQEGYFKVQRDTQQMGIFGGYFGCYDKNCMIAPGPPGHRA